MPRRPADCSTHTIPRETLERLNVLLSLSYEGVWYLADVGRIDWSTVGEPILEALRIVRAIRREDHHVPDNRGSRRAAA